MDSANSSSIDAPAPAGATRRSLPELLAPAGNERALIAAVQSGADAVYAGMHEFSARRGAGNFSPEELAEAVSYAHLRGAKLYLTVNVLVLPEELGRALSACASAREAGVDAFIVQDLGLARLLRAHLPDVPLHASTQISTHGASGVDVLGDLGFSRVTLARELCLEEITGLASGPIPVEVFVHGALCYCYSGQCLMSSMAGGRSGNRGLCVQACRMACELIDAEKGPVEAGGDFPMSTRDLSAIDFLPALARAGVASLKIEGRLKSAEYVATVVDVYRRALDRCAAEQDAYSVPSEDRQALEEVFSRGFTDGYLAGIRDQRMMSPARPSDRGATIGRVSACDAKAGTCDIKLTRELGIGDELEIWVRKGGRIRTKVATLAVDGVAIELAEAGRTATVTIRRPAGVGDRVFRTANARLLEAARARLRPSGAARVTPVDMVARLRVDEAMQLSARTVGDGTEVQIAGPPVQHAKQRPLDAAQVAGHLQRLGGTAYAANQVDVDISGQCFLPVKELHEARARLVEQLDEARLERFRREPKRPRYAPPERRTRKAVRPLLCASVDETGLAAELASGGGLDWIYFDVSFERDWGRPGSELRQVAELAHTAGSRVAVQLPAVLRDAELRDLDTLVDALSGSLDGIIAGSLGQLRYLADRGVDLICDTALNVTNSETLEVLAGFGAMRTALSLEITGQQVSEIGAASSVPIEVVVSGPVQVMVAEHCVYCVPGSCEGCEGRTGALRDANDFVFPVRIDRACRTRVYNPFELSLLKQLPELASAGVNAVRLNLGGYGPAPAVQLIEDVRHVLALLPEAGEDAAKAAERMADGLSQRARYTTGHYYRPLQ